MTATKTDAEYGIVSPDIAHKTAQTQQGSFAYTGTAGASASALEAGYYWAFCTSVAYVSRHASTAVSVTIGNPIPADTMFYFHAAVGDYLRAIRASADGTCYYFKAQL